MLKSRTSRLLTQSNGRRIIIFDRDGIAEDLGLSRLLQENRFTLYKYNNVEEFRVIYEEQIKLCGDQVAILVSDDIYVPYDIRRSFSEVELSMNTLFPKLNSGTVLKHRRDWDIISFASESCYGDLSQAKLTEAFIMDTVLSVEMVIGYCKVKTDELRGLCAAAVSYGDWLEVAKMKALVDYYGAMKGLTNDLSFVDAAFAKFMADGYSRLSLEINSSYPPIVTKVIPWIVDKNHEKIAVIVMDGMSLYDFEVVSRHFQDIEYEFEASYGIVPTMTPLSRQSLLSGKYPRELAKPFSLVEEEKEFRAHAAILGFGYNQVEYLRGFDTCISPLSKLVAIIVNEVDDIAHGQHQGRVGMYNDMNLFGRSGKLQALVTRLVGLGFSVYITSDHGNTPCIGVGGFRSGVEIESRSMRMAVLKDFAEANTLLKEHTVEYPGFYLDKDFRYFICESGVSFDSKGETVVTHGGMSLDEVIVPFIKIKGVG